MNRPKAPPGWRVSDRPMRVALLGWARLSLQAREGSGYNLNASELAAGLVLSGHEVFYLASGMRFSIDPRIRIRESESWRGVSCYDLINSPNFAPAAINFANMGRERWCPKQSAVVLRWLEGVGAEVVHVHSLEGYSLDLIGRMRDRGLPVVVTPHNYWFACPQVDLLHEEVRICEDYDGGRRCVGCLRPRGRRVQRLRRAMGQSADALLGSHGSRVFRTTIDSVGRIARSWRDPNRAWKPPEAEADPEIAQGFEPAGGRGDGRVGVELALSPSERPTELGRAALEANEQFLSPAAGKDRHLTVLNEYGERRVDGIRALNTASIVTPPSEFVGEVYYRMGMAREKLRVVRLGQPHFDRINRRVRRSPYYDCVPWQPESDRPLRLAFLGTVRHNKGLEIVVRAIPRLETSVRQRCQFLIRASGGDWAFRKRLCTYPEVQFAGGYDMLQLMGAVGEYDVGLLPHIWFENSPLVMLEHLHAGKFVISSRLGGPVEWIREGENGTFFAGGDDAGLAERITRIVRGEIRLPSAREIHERTPLLTSYPAYVAEVESIYRRLIAGEAGHLAAWEVEGKSTTEAESMKMSEAVTSAGSSESMSEAAR